MSFRSLDSQSVSHFFFTFCLLNRIILRTNHTNNGVHSRFTKNPISGHFPFALCLWWCVRKFRNHFHLLLVSLGSFRISHLCMVLAAWKANVSFQSLPLHRRQIGMCLRPAVYLVNHCWRASNSRLRGWRRKVWQLLSKPSPFLSIGYHCASSVMEGRGVGIGYTLQYDIGTLLRSVARQFYRVPMKLGLL
jgi:hypothetical protein